MATRKGHALLVPITAVALIAGCGSSDDNSTTTPATATGATSTESTSTTEDSTSTETTSTSSDDSGSSSGSATPESIYSACVDKLAGTPAEGTAQTLCGNARDAFQQCLDKGGSVSGAAGDKIVASCQKAADQTLQAIESAP